MNQFNIPWRLLTLDFEASSIEPGSYPIEIGLAIGRVPDNAIEIWSSLIKPMPAREEAAFGMSNLPRYDSYWMNRLYQAAG